MSQYQEILDLLSLDGTNGFRLQGRGIDGFSVSTGGDINGDGFSDVIIGAPGYQILYTGAAYTVFGGTENFADLDAADGTSDGSISLSNLDGNNGLILNAPPYLYAGRSVSSAGDVNGDGFADVLVGGDGSTGYPGVAFVVFGKNAGFSSSFNLGSVDGNNGFKFVGGTYEHAGFGVSSAGDFNGDGFGDVIVGTGTSSVYIVFGKVSGFPATLQASSLDGANGFKIATHGSPSWSVSSAGDINGDGFDDIIFEDEYGPGSSPVTYVMFGTASNPGATFDVNSLNGSNGFKLVGETLYHSRNIVSGGGDINADGFTDLIVCNKDNGVTPGGAYVVFGKSTGFVASIDLTTSTGWTGFKVVGAETGDSAGMTVTNAGDFNGDGFDDLLVAATGAGNYGASYLIFGAVTLGTTINVGNLDGNNGFTLQGFVGGASGGDVNGDGFDDLVLGGGTTSIVFGGPPAEAVARTGTAIANTIHGGDFGDALSGLGGDDHLIGHDGDDTLNGGIGNDTLDGGDGSDTVTYVSATSGISINLSILTAQAVGGGQGSDTLIGIENIIGSAFNDTLTGDANANVFAGTAGNDMYNAGDGIDTVTFASVVGGGVTVDLHLITPQSVGAGQGNDSFIGVENLIGTSSADTFHGSNAANTFYGGGGTDTLDGAGGSDVLDGGLGNDTFILSGGGNDIAYGGGGSGADAFDFGGAFTLNDTVDGGLGTDSILLNGDYSAGVVFRAQTMTSVETIMVASGFSYAFTLNDANIAQNKTLTIDASAFDSAHTLTVDASREKDGFVAVTGGAGADVLGGGHRTDTIFGGDGDDMLTGGQGSDALNGGSGTDTLVYAGAKDSGGVRYDTVTGLDAQTDRFDLTKAVDAIDAAVTTGSLSVASFKGDMKGLADKEHLGSHHALLVTADAGDLAGVAFLIVDLDGRAGYGSAHDLVIRLDAGANLSDLDVSDFI